MEGCIFRHDQLSPGTNRIVAKGHISRQLTSILDDLIYLQTLGADITHGPANFQGKLDVPVPTCLSPAFAICGTHPSSRFLSVSRAIHHMQLLECASNGIRSWYFSNGGPRRGGHGRP